MVAAGSITVAVRVRPPTSWEAARLPEPCYDTSIRGEGTLSTPGKVVNTAPLRDIVQIVDDRILTFDPDEKDRARAFMERGFMPPGTKRYKDRRFMFDRVFGHEARQQDVYEATSQPLLQGLLEGYNATVFAYGATGCGKTHTISGTDVDPGIIYLTMADLFQRIQDRSEEWNVEVMVTFLEIYNEEIRDLLAEPGSATQRGGLSIREDKTVKVVGLVEMKPRTAEEVKEIVLQGNLRRMQSPTHANETSSRSHAVLQVHLTQSPRTAAITEQRTMATLSIIDLAGSERAAATTNMGQRMVEGANINKSLLALGNCINALCESGGAIRHVPYRNSKLTRLLKFSLGGNCKTVMIVCVAPTSNHFDDTHNTLVYAERATKIKTKVVTRNVVNVDRHVGRYVEAINRLNIEIAELKAKLAGKRTSEQDVQARKKAESKAEVERARKDVQAKLEQTKSAIVDGAICSGKLTVAKAKLDAIQTRLAQINSADGSSSQAEYALLKALAGPEEEVVKPGSALNIRLQRSSNSNAMFDATMRAVSERKSEKLDEVSHENVKLETSFHKATVEKLKAENESNAMREAVTDMAEVIVKLVGMLGRCTVLVGEAAHGLSNPPDTEEGKVASIKNIAKTLENMREKNDDTFKRLLGHSTESYIVKEHFESSVFDNFQNYGATFKKRVSSVPGALQQQAVARSTSRRLSVYENTSISASPPRRSHKSPRKSLRSSLASQPYRRAPEKEKKAAKSVKNVQWRDEVGQGSIDDGGKLSNIPVVEVIPASPSSDAVPAASSKPSIRAPSPLSRPASALGSESDWEDDNEKTEDSMSMSFMSASTSASSSNPLSSSTSRTTRRPRASRLDPSFLKSKSKGSSLGSLREDDENESRSQPLSDMNLNRMGSNEESSGSDSNLHVPKGRDRNPSSPGRRAPSTGKASMLSASASKTTGRRRSNIGPVRNEKTRRRSSIIPPIPPLPDDVAKGGSLSARRVLISASPGKRQKRLSLTRVVNTGSLKLKSTTSSTSVSNLSAVFDPNTSGDLSAGKSGFRPTWR